MAKGKHCEKAATNVLLRDRGCLISYLAVHLAAAAPVADPHFKDLQR